MAEPSLTNGALGRKEACQFDRKPYLLCRKRVKDGYSRLRTATQFQLAMRLYPPFVGDWKTALINCNFYPTTL